MSNIEWNKRKTEATPRGIGVMCNFFVDRAENAELWDIEGKRYIDFAGGIAVVNTGHRHPIIQKAIEAQLNRFIHTAYQTVPYTSYIELAEKLNSLAPIDGPKKAALFSTGAEAVENAIKIARAHTKRMGVISFTGSFHGRTQLGMALTGKVVPYKTSFGISSPGIYHVPFPMEMHGVTVQHSLDAIEYLFKASIAPHDVAAIILEPVQGEGGFYIAPPELMRAIRALCDKHGIVFIADEVQSGFARTGKLFAMEHYDVRPDLMTTAKSLAGGMPLSGVIGKAAIMDAPDPGGLGGTYAGNPLSVASALAVIDTIEKENLVERSQALGKKLQDFLKGIEKTNAHVAHTRGLGSMVGVEFVDAHKKPDAALAKKVQEIALQHGLLILICGVYGNVIRFLYPLTISDATFDEALQILSNAISAATK